MVQDDLVRRLLGHLSGYLDELREHQAVSFDAYRESASVRRIVERLLQLIIEASIDINVHIVAEEEGMPPSDYRSSFIAASRLGVISADLAERLAPSAGLRNALTHDYVDLDDARVHAAIAESLSGFGEYAAEVVRWLEKRSAQ